MSLVKSRSFEDCQGKSYGPNNMEYVGAPTRAGIIKCATQGGEWWGPPQLVIVGWKKKNIELEMYLPLTLVKLKLPSAKHTNNYGKYWKITIVNG